MSSPKTIAMIFGGTIGLSVGGKLIVDSAAEMAHAFGVSERLIGLTILAAGTSLPELATTVVAASKKQSDFATGNIMGSNIFNILLVLGMTGLVSAPLRLSGCFKHWLIRCYGRNIYVVFVHVHL